MAVATHKKNKTPLITEFISSDQSIQVWLSDGLEALKKLPDACADLVLTDPPYGMDQLGVSWKADRIKESIDKAKTVGGLPVGMRFDANQGTTLQAFLLPFFKEAYRVLKPGGFILCFSQARLYHHAAITIENSGFELRDMLGWVYEGQAKAFSQDHFVQKMDWTDDKKAEVIKQLDGRKTPQLKPMIEPIAMGQKPKEGTFIENWLNHGVGLIDVSHAWEGRFPGNLIACPKPTESERGAGNDHPTVKPITMLAQLIQIFAPKNGLVIDPFAGSGSTLLAASATGRRGWGSELYAPYFEIIKSRLEAQSLSKELQQDLFDKCVGQASMGRVNASSTLSIKKAASPPSTKKGALKKKKAVKGASGSNESKGTSKSEGQGDLT